jgi:hypothetical protein
MKLAAVGSWKALSYVSPLLSLPGQRLEERSKFLLDSVGRFAASRPQASSTTDMAERF